MRSLLLSDTHGNHEDLELPRNKFSLAMHTGDFTNRGTEWEVDNFLTWFSELNCKHKILIAGNHDFIAEKYPHQMKLKCNTLGITYLQDESIIINGIKFYGTPYVNQFFDWAFMRSERNLLEIYEKIPKDTDVLLTHGPAMWLLDEVKRGHVGSESLANILNERKNIKYHIFGHIHECGGQEIKITHDDKNSTRHINASLMDKFYYIRKPKSINITK
jgi:Icc-related predicted phosphoesterase